MNRFIHIVIVGSFMLPLSAFPISRIGGGKVGSLSSGFEGRLPMTYREISNREDKFHLFVFPIPSMSDVKNPTLVLSEVKDVHTDISNYNRAGSRDYFRSLGFYLVSEFYQLDRCIDIFLKEEETSSQYVLVWGRGRGFQLGASRDHQAYSDAQRLIQSVELLKDACAWE